MGPPEGEEGGRAWGVHREASVRWPSVRCASEVSVRWCEKCDGGGSDVRIA